MPVACTAQPGAPFEKHVSTSPASMPENWLWSGGVVAGDLLSDTLNDLVAPAEPFAKAYKGTALGTFPEDPCLDPFDLSFGTGGSVADFDGDGLLDLYVTRFDRPNKLLHNNGDFTFSDVTDFAGVGASGPSMASSWADFDHDGDLDLFVGEYASVRDISTRADGTPNPSFLYVNDGTGHFTDRSDLLPPSVNDAWVMSAAWVDVNADGWVDLYVVSDWGDGTGNVLVMNEFGTLVPDGNRRGLDLKMAGTALASADINGDNLPDFLISERTETGNLSLLLSGGDYWYDAAKPLGITADDAKNQHDPWGVQLGDLDNDGDIDAIASFGQTSVDDPDSPADQVDALFVQGDDRSFTEQAGDWQLGDSGRNRGITLADMNNDGFLDIAKRDLDGPNLLYTSRCDSMGWLRIQLADPGPNSFAIGARVVVENGGRSWDRTIDGGGFGFASAGPPEAQFGLGALDKVDRVTVTWPDGAESILEDLPTRAVVRIERLEE
jgi:hypothetical protein